MTAYTNTIHSWNAFFDAPSDGSAFFSSIREALGSTYNDSEICSRQTLREILLLFLLGDDREELCALLERIERSGIFLEDARSQTLIAVCKFFLALAPHEIGLLDNSLLAAPSFPGIEYAFLLLVLGELYGDQALLESGGAYLNAVASFDTSYPMAFGVDLREYELITADGVLAAYQKRPSQEYPGRIENAQLFQRLAENLKEYTHIPAKKFPQIFSEEIGKGKWFETGVGNQSGFFSYLREDVGIVVAAPSFFPLCEKTTFGIVSESRSEHCVSFQKEFASGRIDIGWLHWQKKILNSKLQAVFRTVAAEEVYPLALCFFLRAREIIIDGQKRIVAHSLDKYQSDAKMVECLSENKNFIIDPKYRGEMQVIPLAGENHFFGADYLLAFVIESERETLSIAFEHTGNDSKIGIRPREAPRI